MALLTTGTTTGLVIDCGNLETTVLPVRRKFYLFILLLSDQVNKKKKKILT